MAALIERYNRTLRTRFAKIFQQQGNNKWITVLPAIVEATRNALNRSTGMKPKDVNFANAPDVSRRLYGGQKMPATTPRYSIGSKVRIYLKGNIFAKSDRPSFSSEIFTVSKHISSIPLKYQLTDANNHVMYQNYYEQQLLPYLKQ